MAAAEMATMCNWWESMAEAVLSINPLSTGQRCPELHWCEEKGLALLTFLNAGEGFSMLEALLSSGSFLRKEMLAADN